MDYWSVCKSKWPYSSWFKVFDISSWRLELHVFTLRNSVGPSDLSFAQKSSWMFNLQPLKPNSSNFFFVSVFLVLLIAPIMSHITEKDIYNHQTSVMAPLARKVKVCMLSMLALVYLYHSITWELRLYTCICEAVSKFMAISSGSARWLVEWGV